MTLLCSLYSAIFLSLQGQIQSGVRSGIRIAQASEVSVLFLSNFNIIKINIDYYLSLFN